MRTFALFTLVSALLPGTVVRSEESDQRRRIKQIITAANGEDKLLKLFRIKERLNVTSDPEEQGNERVSVLEPPKYW